MSPRKPLATPTTRRSWLPLLVLLLLAASAPTARATHAAGSSGPAALPAQQGDASGSDTVKCVLRMPFHPPTLPLPIVSITVGDSKPMWFLVDTGSNAAMTLAHWAAQELRLDKRPDATRTDKIIDGKTYDDYHFAPTLLCVVAAAPGSSNLGINVLNVDCARDDSEIIDRDFRTPHLAGIVGINFWSNFTTQFDFARQTLTVFVDHPDPGSSAARVANPDVVPEDKNVVALAMRPWPGFEPITQVRLSSPRPEGDFGLTNDGASTVPLPSDLWLVLDTGSDSTDLPEALRPPGGAQGVSGSVPRSMVHQHNQSVSVEAGQLSSLTLDGQLTEPNVDIKWFRGSLTPNLGMDFLRRFVITIDTRHNRIYLQHSSNYTDAFWQPGVPGLALHGDSRGYYVVSRVFDEPLRQAGIVPGDEIVEIDGYDLRLYSRYQVSALANGFAGTAACFMVRHKGSATAVAVWVLRSTARMSLRPGRTGADPAIRLTSPDSCVVTYADGKSVAVPFYGNPDTLPLGKAPEGTFFQRVQAADGAFGWVIVSRH